MRRSVALPIGVLSLALLSACQDKEARPEDEMRELRQAMIRKTEQIYLIHLKLDSASKDITSAEMKARNADCSDAEYLAADAYRNLEKADQDLLELGRELQELFNLDVSQANRD